LHLSFETAAEGLARILARLLHIAAIGIVLFVWVVLSPFSWCVALDVRFLNFVGDREEFLSAAWELSNEVPLIAVVAAVVGWILRRNWKSALMLVLCGSLFSMDGTIHFWMID
jgi:hypothetical protein